MKNNIIWQYWETKGRKPLFVDELRYIAKKNSGIEVILVTPENIRDYLPDIPDEIFKIEELAHKADMIRARLIYTHGGMWLDSDAIVLSDLNWLFDMLTEYEFIGFNDHGRFDESPLNVRINCFVSKPKSKVMEQWVTAQSAKFPKTVYNWTEVGTDLLDPIIVTNQASVKLLPFDLICPIRWNEVSRFTSRWENSKKILTNAQVVMLSNKSLQERNPKLTQTPVSELASDDTLIADIIKKALDPNFEPESYVIKIMKNIKKKLI